MKITITVDTTQYEVSVKGPSTADEDIQDVLRVQSRALASEMGRVLSLPHMRVVSSYEEADNVSAR